MNPVNQRLGFHYIWDVSGCNHESLATVSPIKSIMDEILAVTGLTVLKEAYNQFAPHGVTGVYLLAESHFSIHTWPENGYAAFDLFSCIPVNQTDQIAEIMRNHLGEQVNINLRTLSREVDVKVVSDSLTV